MTSSPMSILVVDDVPKNLMALRALLEELDPDMTVLTADSGPAALELLLEHEVALALLDVQMPGMDGYALAELMRGSQRTRLVPIIFITAFAPDEQRSFRGYECGAVDLLYKPVDARLLRSKVQVFVELYQQRMQLASRMAELERVARLNALMIGALSHDIRTPLAALSLNAELVSRRTDVPGLHQVGVRLKSATTMLSRQVDHLVNLALLPANDMRPERVDTDLAALLQARLAASPSLGEQGSGLATHFTGDSRAMLDPALLTQAIDHLLMLALVHGNGRPAHVEVDGESRRAVVLRLRLEAPLPESAQAYLFGSGQAEPGLSVARVGPGLDASERVARAHGGSLIGRSRERDGTLFEMILPRANE